MCCSLETYNYQHHNSEYAFIQDKDGNIYNNDDMCTIRTKCILLLIGTPIASVLRAIYHLGSLLYKLVWYPIQLMKGKITWKEACKELTNHALDIFASIFYGICMEASALYGIADPLNGRYGYGVMERALNRDGFKDKSKFYLAVCFQPITHINSDKMNDRLTNYTTSHLRPRTI